MDAADSVYWVLVFGLEARGMYVYIVIATSAKMIGNTEENDV
jgi:hypothetical protein